jgi:hypothetical protein
MSVGPDFKGREGDDLPCRGRTPRATEKVKRVNALDLNDSKLAATASSRQVADLADKDDALKQMDRALFQSRWIGKAL